MGYFSLFRPTSFVRGRLRRFQIVLMGVAVAFFLGYYSGYGTLLAELFPTRVRSRGNGFLLLRGWNWHGPGTCHHGISIIPFWHRKSLYDRFNHFRKSAEILIRLFPETIEKSSKGSLSSPYAQHAMDHPQDRNAEAQQETIPVMVSFPCFLNWGLQRSIPPEVPLLRVSSLPSWVLPGSNPEGLWPAGAEQFALVPYFFLPGTIASLAALATLIFTPVLSAGIFIGSPVAGLRPVQR